ncbi:MAG TPA: hypothetical protein DCX06_05105 [Opitutae bacterium]|nr:hypothetical protein [Opitutae bacterium]
MKWLLPLSALSIGLLLGWFLAGSPSADSTAHGAKGSGGLSVVEVTHPQGDSYVEKGAAASVSVRAGSLKSLSDTDAWLKELEGKDQLDQMEALLARMKSADTGDFAMLMDGVQKYPRSLRWMAQTMLATKWAESDPQGMLVYIDKQPMDQQWGLRNSFYGAWAKENPQVAYQSALKLSNQRAQQSAMQAVIQTVAVEDPRAAVEMAKNMQELGHRADWLMRNIYQTWANEDLETARSAALAMPDGPQKVQALSGALNNWMQDDPMAALGWLESLPIDGTVYNSKKEVFRRLLNQDFDTAKAFIEAKSDPMERREVLESISFSNLSWKKDFEQIEAMYHWVGEVATGQVYDNKVGDVMRALVQVDRERAEAFVMNLPAGSARMNAIGSFAQQMAEQDPAAAIEFASSLAYEDEKRRALSNMGWQISRYGVDAVKTIVAQTSDSDVQRELASRVVADWSKYDQPGALEWAESLGDDQARSSALQSVYKNWMQADPVAALSYLETSVEEGKQANYLRSGFQEWAQQDPQAAVEMLDRIPATLNEQQNADIYSSVTRTFVRHDPMAASEWISTLERGMNRDKSVETLTRTISKTDPEAGFLWASTIDNEDLRKNSLSQSVRYWVKNDIDAAYEAVTDSKIEASEKESLFQMIESAR